MAKLRQVPSGLNPALDGFLRDLRDAVSLGIPQSTIKEIMTQAASVATETVMNNQTTIEAYIGNMVSQVVDSVLNDPNYIALGDKIDVINGPESLPASVRGQLVTLNGQLQAGIDANGSAIVTLQNTTATQAIQIAGLGTRVENAESTIVTLNATTANQATQLTTLNTTVGNNSASIQTLQSTTNGLSAQYSVKLDVNGYVTGYGLYNQGSSSQFYIRADKFAIGSPGYTNIVPFTVLSSWQGTSPPGIYVSGDAFIDGTLYAKKIVAGSITTDRIGTDQITKAEGSTGGTYWFSGINGANYATTPSSNLASLAVTSTTDAAIRTVIMTFTLDHDDTSNGYISCQLLNNGGTVADVTGNNCFRYVDISNRMVSGSNTSSHTFCFDIPTSAGSSNTFSFRVTLINGTSNSWGASATVSIQYPQITCLTTKR